MKTVFVGLIALSASFGSIAHASSIDSACSDAAQSFALSGHGGSTGDVVRIRLDYKGRTAEFNTYEDQVSIEFKELQDLGEERGSGWMKRSSVQQVTIRPLGKTVLPNAYSRLKNADGSLTETVLCTMSYVSSPIMKK